MNPPAGREIHWNVYFPGIGAAMFIIGLIPIAVVAWALVRRWRLWRAMGQGRLCLGEAWKNPGRLFRHVLGQKRIIRKAYAGWAPCAMHSSFR